MNLKKLKRLLSLTLTAAMVASMISVPVNAETVTDNTAAAMEEMIADPADEDVADDAEGTDTADNVEDVADETEDSDVVDETEDEGTAEAAEEELFNAREAGDGSTGDGTGDSGTTTTPEAPSALVVGNGEGQFPTLQAAIAEATKEGATLKKIELSKNAELAGDITLAENSGVEIDTKGHSIVIPVGAEVTLTNAKITNSVAVKSCTILSQGTLTIVGGEYTTMGGQMFRIEGTANMSGATISCPTEAGTTENNWYDALPIISVHGVKGKLTITSGTINANVGNGSNCGMYGIGVLEGAEVILGEKNADNNALTVNSVFSAVTMNGSFAPGRITVNSGTYNSSVSCTAANEKKFNAVIYLPATANVNINGGVFTATAQNPDAHVIAIPYDVVGPGSVRVNLNITGGTFTSQGTVFNHPHVATTSKARIAISGGTFSSDLKAELANTGIADGYQVYEQTGEAGKKSYIVSTSAIVTVNGVPFNNLQQAITAAKAGANETEQTITLGKDLELTDAAYDLEGVIVDTAGHMFTIPEGRSVTLTKGTVKNTQLAEFSDGKITNSRTMFQVDGSLTIHGGTYETKGIHLMRVSGAAVIDGGASFKGAAASTEIGSLGNYDGASLIGVTGTGAKLTVKDATIEATVGNADNTDGMYGIYVEYGAELVLGEADKVPTITSTLSAVGMNGLTAPGKITINGGTYTSNASVTADNLKNYNAVLYFPASANVTINDGTFVAAGTAGERHVISVPYNILHGKHVKLNLIINNGTFKVNEEASATGAIFFDDGMKDQDGEKTANRISVRGGTFVNYEPAYVAGCHGVVHENDSKEWMVSPEENAEHTLTWVAMQKATCWEEGVIGHYECLNCHKMYNKKTDDKKELFAEDVAIPREEHVGNGTHHDAHPATCTTAGNKEYVKCEKCGLCYPNQAKLDEDTKGEIGVPESEMIINATGHTYPRKQTEDGTEGDFVIAIEKEDLSYNDFVEGQANGVVVTRTCSVCDASDNAEVKAGAVQTASTVAVAAKEGNPTINCQEAQTLNYTVTASFDKFTTDKDGNLTVENGVETATEGFSFTTTAGSHSYDLETVSFNWDNFDIATFKTGEANGVTATGKCKVCGNDEVEASVTVTSTDYPASSAGLDCKVDYHFIAKATFGTATPVNSEEKALPGVHVLTWKQDYVAPTCLTEGQWGAYECTACKQLFLGEDSAKEGHSVTEAELVIAKRAHAIQLKGFSWTNTDQTEAKATFYCTSCKKTLDVLVENANIKFNADGSQTAACGVEVNQVYDVSVELEKTAVTVGTDGNFVYNPTTDGKKTTYPGKLNKKTLQPHIFVTKGTEGQPDTANVELKWMDDNSADENKVHDVSKGVKVIMTCTGTCGTHIAVASKGGIIDDETNMPEETLVIPYVKLALNETESAKTKATCVAGGTAVYDVTISYDNGTGMQELDSKSISTATPVDKNAHAWTALAWKEWVEKEPAKTENGVRIPPVYSIKATRHCTNEGCETYPGTQEVDSEGNPVVDGDGNPVLKEQKFETVTTVPTDENAPYILVDTEVEQKKTCIRSGITNYVATAYFNGEAVKNSLGSEDRPTPAVYNDPVEGHKIELKWKWDEVYKDSADPTSPVTKLTGLTVERYCPNCSDSKDPDVQGKDWVVPHDTYTLEIGENATEQSPSVDETGKLSVYKEGTGATCDEPGNSKYIATLNYTNTDVYENTRVLVNAALGHDMKWFITWNNDQEHGQGSENWVASMQKKCTRNDVAEGTPTVATISYNKDDATCLAEGKEVWTITNLPSQADADYATGTEKFKEKDLPIDMTNGHEFSTATVTPATTTTVITVNGVEKEVLAVTFARTCQKDGADESHTASVTLNATTTDKPEDCSKGYTLNFSVSAEEVKTLTDAGWELPENYTGTFEHEVLAAEGRTNHDLIRVAGGSSNDCNAEIHPTYYECKRCAKRYTTQSALTEYKGPGQGDGQPQGHLYGQPEFTWIEEGKTVQATFRCTRSGCTGDVTIGDKVSPKELTLVALLDEEPYVDTPAQCIGMKDDAGNLTGTGLAYGLANLTISEQNAQGSLKVGDYFESELEMTIAPGPHVFENGECKWCHTEEAARVIFKGHNGNELSSEYYPAGTSAADIVVPTAPNRFGYDFVGWQLNGTGNPYDSDKIAAEIVKLLSDKGEIILTAIYKLSQVSQADVTVTNLYRADGSADVTGTTNTVKVDIGTRYTATSTKDTDDKYKDYEFSHWEINGEVVGTNASYELLIQNAVTIHAVYVLGEKEEAKPVVAITDVYGSVVDGSYKLSFVSNMSYPNDYQVVDSGFVYCNVNAEQISEDELVLSSTNTNVRIKQLGGIKTNIFSLNLGTDTTGMRRGTKVAARAYVKLVKGDQVYELYSSMMVKSYNDVVPAAK